MTPNEFTRQITIAEKTYTIADINLLEKKGIANISRLPYSIRILVENLLRKLDDNVVYEKDLLNIAQWKTRYDEPVEIPYHPARVLMQDFTGVPAVVDLAAMRDAVKKMGGNPERINPLVPVELIIDHSVSADYAGTPDALLKNVEKEFARNKERYQLLKWAQNSFDNFKVVPPGSGICHQVNLECLGRVVIVDGDRKNGFAFPDTVVGTDSHTTMINGLGVVGWGVGGIEAEAVMLGQPYYLSIPEVIGVRLTGRLRPGINATDLALSVTEMLRKHNVVEKFVEFFGPGVQTLEITDRATVANMAPEYGATIGFFPVDEKTIDYLRLTHRDKEADITERYARETGLFYVEPDGSESCPIEYTDIIDIDLSSISTSLAGPSQPRQRIPLNELKTRFDETAGEKSGKTCEVYLGGKKVKIADGSIAIAAITSCTNTSNPYGMIGAGLLAKKAVEKGLTAHPFVKTSLAPGSRVVADYLSDAGLLPFLEKLGFYLVGFGCGSCIGNSGPLHPEIETAISENNLLTASILSGNRNFEARIHQSVKANYLASPILVVAFAIAGRIDMDADQEPLGVDAAGAPVYLADIWPSSEEINALVARHVKKEFFQKEYETVFQGDDFWKAIDTSQSAAYDWDEDSAYIRNPPYFEDFEIAFDAPSDIKDAKALLFLGDSVTTDHISPASAIPFDYPAGQYLAGQNVEKKDFNSYGSRRGNHEVMMRGSFSNIRIKNRLAAPVEGGVTRKSPGGDVEYVYDAAMDYIKEKRPSIVLAGTEYGTGSSRDWAAKGTHLLGVKAVIARSFERIHRSNLIGMGVLPLVFKVNESPESLGLDGFETFSITGVENITPGKTISVTAEKEDGRKIHFQTVSRLDTQVDVDYFEHGGILRYVLRKILADLDD